jgi:2-C-methyl-D-erythritol 4-phosphate cytidylyltransferase
MSDRWSPSSSPEAAPRVRAVIVAGGSGRRMGGAGRAPKQYLRLRGVPILRWAVQPFLDHPGVHEVVVVLPPADAGEPPEWLRSLPVHVVAGGAERSDSVWNGLQALPGEDGLVLVHDGARPFVTHELIDRVIRAAPAGGAIPGLRATDTLKQVDAAGRVVATLDRDRVFGAQTPQGFPLGLLLRAYRTAREEGWPSTDDATLFERLGAEVRVVEGSPENLKITRPVDLAVAELLARHLPAPPAL